MLWFNKSKKDDKDALLKAESENQEQDEQDKKDMMQLAMNAFVNKQNAKQKKLREERKKQMFQRTPDNIIANTAKGSSKKAFAMDGGLMDRMRPDKTSLDGEVIDRISDHFIGWASCAILKQVWIIDRACTIPAEDAIAPGWKLAYADFDEADENADGEIYENEQIARDKKLHDIEVSAKEFNIAKICEKAETLKKVFGYCLVVPNIDDVDMSVPFTEDAVKGKTYRGFSVIEPMWILPQFDADGMTPGNENFYNPAWYQIAGNGNRKIHRSWCVKLINSPVPDILKPTYYFGGVPLTQQIYKRVYCAEKVADEAPMLAMTKRLLAIEGDLYMAISDPENFDKQMEQFSQLRDNFGVAMTQKDSNLHQIDTSLTDFDQLIMTQYQLVASIAQMPITKLLKVQIRGFDSSGEYERGDYIQSLISIQQNDFNPIIDMHNKLFCLCKYGENINLKVDWNEVDTPTAKENAEIEFIHAQRDATMINSGVLSQDEVRNRLRRDAKSGYTTITREAPLPEMQDDLLDGSGVEKEQYMTTGGSGQNMPTDRIMHGLK